jgi:3-methyladenine DNA glycosylase AlkD
MPPDEIDPKILTGTIRNQIATLRPSNTPNLRILRRQISKQLADAEPRVVIDVALHMLEGLDGGHRFIAYELIRHHASALASLREKDLLRLGRGLDSWGAVDCFACFLSGQVWRRGQVGDGLIHRWARSPDRWWRRAALVSTVPLNNRTQGGQGDAERTLFVCSMLLADRDDMVVKAMSWALRELAKRDAESVRAFVTARHDIIAPRVRREVGNKLSTGLKNPRSKNV